MPVNPSVPWWMRIPVCFSFDSLAGSSLPPEHSFIKSYFLVSSPHRVLLLLWRGPGTKHRAVSGLMSHSQREQSPRLQNPYFEEWWVSVWVELTPLVLQSNASVVPGLAYLNCGLGYCKSQMSSASQCRISPADLTTVPWGRKKTLKKKMVWSKETALNGYSKGLSSATSSAEVWLQLQPFHSLITLTARDSGSSMYSWLLGMLCPSYHLLSICCVFLGIWPWPTDSCCMTLGPVAIEKGK